MSAPPQDGETRWWWVRHAPVINPGGAIYGRQDIPADVSDQTSLQGTAGRLPPGAAWVITPLQRTRQTADGLRTAVGGRLDVASVHVEPALMEQDFGDWQGLTRADLYADSVEPHPFWVSPATARPPGGESFADLMSRVGPAIERLSVAHAGQDIVAVCHGGPIRAAIALALGLDPETALRFVIDTLSVTRLDLLRFGQAEPAWRVGGINLPPR